MAEYYGFEGTVRRLTGITDESLTDNEIRNYLKDATNHIDALHNGALIREVKFIPTRKTDNSQWVFSLLYSVNKTIYKPKVYDGNDLVDSSKYSFENNFIIFDEDSLTHAKVIIWYKPDFLNAYASVVAAKDIMRSRLVNLPEGTESSGIVSSLGAKQKEYEGKFKRIPHSAGVADHRGDYGIW